MFLQVSRFCMPWKSHRYYACGQTILFTNSLDWGRRCCEREDEARSRQTLGTDCLCSYLLCVSASIKGRPSSPTGWFEASTSLLALPHADLPTLGAFMPITHKYVLEKPPSNFLITPSSSPVSHSWKCECQSCCHKAPTFQVYHGESPCTLNSFLSFAHRLSPSGCPLFFGDMSHCHHILWACGKLCLVPCCSLKTMKLSLSPCSSFVSSHHLVLVVSPPMLVTLAPNVGPEALTTRGAHLQGYLPPEAAPVLLTSLSALSSAACSTTSPFSPYRASIHPVAHPLPSFSYYNYNPLTSHQIPTQPVPLFPVHTSFCSTWFPSPGTWSLQPLGCCPPQWPKGI